MSERCVYRDAFDPQTLEPIGPECGASATQTIYWKDGRVSTACRDHGIEVLAPSALALVAAVVEVST